MFLPPQLARRLWAQGFKQPRPLLPRLPAGRIDSDNENIYSAIF